MGSARGKIKARDYITAGELLATATDSAYQPILKSSRSRPMSEATEIRWPEHYPLRDAPIHVRNEIDIAAAPPDLALERAGVSQPNVEISSDLVGRAGG